MNKSIACLTFALGLSASSLVAQTAGNLTSERWGNLPSGYSLIELQQEGISARPADSAGLLAGAEWGSGLGSLYGVRLRGTVTAPVTGEYTFFVSGDDSTELYLSSDSSRFGKQRIAWQHNHTNLNQWDKYRTQRSKLVKLVAGQKYYIEAQMAEVVGGDHLSIGWAHNEASSTELAIGAGVTPAWTENDGVHSLSVVSGDITGTSDSFGFKYRSWTGDGAFVARVSDMNFPHVWAKAGLMLRASLDANSAHASMIRSSGRGMSFQRRLSTGAGSQQTRNPDTVEWVKLERRGDLVVGYSSEDGKNWREIGAVTLPDLPETIYVGMAASSHGSGTAVTATIDQLAYQPLVATEVIPASQLKSLAADTNDVDDDNLPDDWVQQHGIGSEAVINLTQQSGVVATQSTTAFSGDASRAIDGNLSANYNGGSVTHTGNSNDSWWQVDLGSDSPIQEVVLWNRDSHLERLSNFRISVLDAEGAELAGQNFYTESGFVPITGHSWKVPAGINGRSVRVQLLGVNLANNGVLSLTEVQVFDQVNDDIVGKHGEYGDFDNDGISNLLEYQLGTNPKQKEARLDGLTRERWNVIGGTLVTDLTGNDRRFLLPPSEIAHVARIDENNQGLNYGSRYRGTITAPTTGEYTFWIAGDDDFELWLADGTLVKDIEGEAKALTNGYGKQKIASLDDERFDTPFTGERAFDTVPSQRSRRIELTAGQHYYIEALYKQGTGLDHVAVAWQVPGGEREIIPASAFSSHVPEDDDLDDDYLPAAWETQYGLNPADNGLNDSRDGQYGDWDQDGLTNFEEYQLGTDPTSADTDGDGLSDLEEVNRFGTDPAVSNQINPSLNTEVDLTQFSSTTNLWSVDENGSLVSSDRRGVIEYSFTVAEGEEGVFEINITGGASGNVGSEEFLPLEISVDGNFLDEQTLVSLNGASSTVRQLTPFLAAGTYIVGINSTNYRAGISLRLDNVSIFRLGGLDINDNGVADGLETKLALENKITRLPATSAVSPLCVEAITTDIAYADISKSITDSLTGVTTQQSQLLFEGVDDGIYANITLNESGSTEITANFQSGAKTETRNVTWSETNVLTTNDITIRQGDALKLTAWGGGSANGSYTLSLNTNPATITPVEGNFRGYLPTEADSAVSAWYGLSLTELSSVIGLIQGEIQTEAVEATAYHLVISDNEASVQLQSYDGSVTKAVKIQLVQVGNDIAAYQVYARTKDGDHQGSDFDSITATEVTAGSEGLGITTVSLDFDYGDSVVIDLTAGGAQAATAPLAYTFSIPGKHVLTATWSPADGSAAVSSSMNVDVLTADFGSGLEVLTYNERVWELPGIGSEIELDVDARLHWLEDHSVAEDAPRSFAVNTFEDGTRHVLARLPGDGAIVARGEVHGSNLASVSETGDTTVVTQYLDGTDLLSFTYVAENLPADAVIIFRSLFQGTTFLDGGNELILTAADFDENGIARIHLERPPSLSGRKVCHNVEVLFR